MAILKENIAFCERIAFCVLHEMLCFLSISSIAIAFAGLDKHTLNGRLYLMVMFIYSLFVTSGLLSRLVNSGVNRTHWFASQIVNLI